MTTSGTTAFALAGSDVLLEAFERLQIRASEITPDHVISARRSMNLVQARWANRGTNLWKVDATQAPVTIALAQGVATYDLDPSTVMVLDAYLRVFAMGPPVNLTPAFATTGGSPSVTITEANHGLRLGEYVNIVVPVALGGLILQGFYQVASVLSSSQFTINAAGDAMSTASGGAVPSFATTLGSAAVVVALADHGLVAGGSFAVQVPTMLGGITLSGPYTVATVPDADHFTIIAPAAAGSSAVASENGGLAQLAGQTEEVDPVDRILTPMSRSDYAATPDKLQQAPPTVYVFDRQAAQPTITLWQVPDSNGPYELRLYSVRQLQDANALLGENPDIPYRFAEALCAELALHLARKFPPRPESGITIADLKLAAMEAWEEAAQEDRERVSAYFVPDFSSYFR
ncbi:MAG TPA: hypothetical protein VMF12_19385 [Xanthobacteraceae bacterium]|nr:hypothetical protein [Xanthobacteraceae bacterium]HUC64578.1 hypothetical protein [Stellaceae bacterium]